MHTFSRDEENVLMRIESLEDELVRLALDLGDMDTSQPHEGRAGEYVYEWEKENGLCPKKLGASARFNVLGKLPGEGNGFSLLFCSHLDNESRIQVEYRLKDWEKPIYTRAWQEEDTLVGHGICNDRGPMACWLIAAKAIKETAARHAGDILLESVSELL